jgi:hypothetical protein
VLWTTKPTVYRRKRWNTTRHAKTAVLILNARLPATMTDTPCRSRHGYTARYRAPNIKQVKESRENERGFGNLGKVCGERLVI